MLTGTEEQNRLTGKIIGLAIRVHTRLGPGLLEHSYLRCFRYELEKAGLNVQTEVFVDLRYDDLIVERAYRLDLLVENLVVVEIKAVEKVLPVHHSQVLTYLKLTGKPIGLLLNFNVTKLPDGIKRFRRDNACGP
jgi:GxxExxY protein